MKNTSYICLTKKRKNTFMRKTLYALLASAALCSCANQYTIEGQTSSSDFEGKKITLKTVSADGMTSIDSCEVIHGNFKMSGKCDSICMAELFLDGTPLMPLLLEAVPLEVSINDTVMRVKGTELNEHLYDFIYKKAELEQMANELPRVQSRMIMDGKDEDEINYYLNAQMQQISAEYDKLVMEYLTQNFDNMLSVGVFMLHTQNSTPMINAQIEDIMSKASDSFKNNAYVKEFMKTAEENQRNMYGR